MKVLLLHNNNIPISAITNCNEDGFVFDIEKQILRPTIDDDDYDVFISDELGEIFEKSNYDCIILPYSFSLENYLEYTGLRVALHIRLTPEWKHTHTPILFVGPDNEKHVAKFSEIGSLLATSGIFKTQKTDSKDIRKILLWINEHCREITDTQYKKFLQRIYVPSPIQFRSHHSIANKWAIQRWYELFGRSDESPVKDFTQQLYFKWLEAKNNHRRIKKKDILPAIRIDNIVNSVVLYIDDEYKGWQGLLQPLCANSRSELRCFDGFDSAITKCDLIESIKTWIDKQEENFDDTQVPIYVIDLRLHDDDFNATDLSGLQILKYIKKKNRGNQVVIFTASNKSWNMQVSLIDGHATAYVIKESPEHTTSAQDTRDLYDEFSRAIQKCYKSGYKRRYVSTIKGIEGNSLSNSDIDTGLKAFEDMLIIDDKSLAYAMCVQLIGVIENFIRENYTLDIPSGTVKLKEDENSRKERLFQFDVRNTISATFAIPKRDSSQKEIMFFKELTKENDLNKDLILPSVVTDSEYVNTLSITCLKYIYKLTDEKINKYWEIKMLRNGYVHVSTSTNKRELELADMTFLFEKIITPLFS